MDWVGIVGTYDWEEISWSAEAVGLFGIGIWLLLWEEEEETEEEEMGRGIWDADEVEGVGMGICGT